MNSIPATQPTQILSSFSERKRIIVPVQLFVTKFAATRVNLCWLLHFGNSCVGTVTSIEAIKGGHGEQQAQEGGSRAG